MPEITLQPVTSDNASASSGDASAVVTALAIDYENLDSTYGQDDAKTPGDHLFVAIYDTGSVPMGAKVKRIKTEVMPSATDAGNFTLDHDVLALDTRFDKSTIRHHNAQWIYSPSSALFGITPIWGNARSSGSNKNVPYTYNIAYGTGNMNQAWTCNTTTTLRSHWVYVKRTGTWPTATCRINTYNADPASSPGSYTKGTLVDTGASKDVDLLSTTQAASGFLPGSAFGVTATNVYIMELEFLETGSGTDKVEFGILTTADGSTDQATIHSTTLRADKFLDGFGGYTQWLTGIELTAAAKIGSTDAVEAPDYTSGTLFTMGNPVADDNTYLTDPLGTHELELPNFMASFQAALDARTSTTQRIAIRMQDPDGANDNRARFFTSSRHGTPTSGSDFGMLLTLDYAAGGTRQVRRMGRNIIRRRRSGRKC